MPQGEIEKTISLFIKNQFPAIYREDGPELVKLVEEYYKWSETQQNQHIYQARRLFETRDIDTTMDSMIILFKKKFLADLPLKADLVKFIVKNILDLYQAKGTARGIELFFAIFYQESEIEILYPAEKMQKVSDSVWKQGTYLQMFPNNNFFTSKTGKEYAYIDLLARNIEGSVTGAKASVRSINFFILNGIKTPVIYLDGIQGTFNKYEDILCKVDGEVVQFGKTNGSLSKFTIVDRSDVGAKRKNLAGRKIGEVLNVLQKDGNAGKAIVTAVTDTASGQIKYDLVDGGYGYTIDNTRLLVSDQSIILDNSENGFNQEFVIGETLQDANGNTGKVIGQNLSSIGIKLDPASAVDGFDANIAVTTVRPPIDGVAQPQLVINLSDVANQLVPVNGSSPGLLYPDTLSVDDVKVSGLSDASIASIITDVILPYVSITLDAADYGAVTPMSGTASPVTIDTPLDQAFDIQDLTIGSIIGFDNINPGADYQNDVFAIAQDSLLKNVDRKNQVVLFADAGDAGSFSVKDRIIGLTSGIKGIVKDVNQQDGFITITPFNINGLNKNENIAFENSPSEVKNVLSISTDYIGTARFGDNAIIKSETEFAVGKISEVNILNSGFGYWEYEVDESQVTDFANGLGELRTDDNEFVSHGIIKADTQGITSGYWAGTNSQISGWIQNSVTTTTTNLPTADLPIIVAQIALGFDPILDYPALAPAFITWFSGIASDGFAIYDLSKEGLPLNLLPYAFTSTLLTQIRSGTAAANITARWNDIVVPSMKNQFWYNSMENLVWEFGEEINVYDQEYFDSGQRIQDSNFYQEYSYQIKSSLPIQNYEKLLKENVHLAGSKLFGDFIFKAKVGGTIKPRFLRRFNDKGLGSPFDVADVTELNASVTNFTSDSTSVSADHTPGGTGGLTLVQSNAADLTITKNWNQGFHDYSITAAIPSGSGPFPVAILLHGEGETGSAMVTQFADELPGHICIGVDGYENSWNVSNETSNGPDIIMLKELIVKLKLYNNVDENKIRIVGVSNGGSLALRAAVEIDDLSVDTIVCMISQTHDFQYRNSAFWYPLNDLYTGDEWPQDGYTTQKTPIPQRRIVQMNGRADTVVPYAGGSFVGINFLPAPESAFRFAQAQGYTGLQLTTGPLYGVTSRIYDYGNVIFFREDVAHVVSDDMKHLLGQYLENDYDIITQPS
jgi:poly(3-hydroxybutyrate) depolymerase